MTTTTDYDVLIIGGGSAGLSAGLMLARSLRRVLVLDGGAPRNAVAAHMHGVLGRDGWSPLDLVATGREEVERYGGTIDARRAIGIEGGPDRFVAELEGGDRVSARRLLVASGLRDGLPPIPGLAEHWGSGVAHCPYCDGWEARGSRIAVVATGPGSVHQAQLLRQLSPRVTVFPNGIALPEPALADLEVRGIAIESRPIAALEADGGGVRGLRLQDGAVIPTDTVFVRPRAIPNDALLRELGAETRAGLDEQDWVVVDGTGRTTAPGVWAAGNVVDPVATVPVAAASGTMAGAAINADLVDAEIRSAHAARAAAQAERDAERGTAA